MDTEITIAIQIQEQVFEDTGEKRKQELMTIMSGLENWGFRRKQVRKKTGGQPERKGDERERKRRKKVQK